MEVIMILAGRSCLYVMLAVSLCGGVPALHGGAITESSLVPGCRPGGQFEMNGNIRVHVTLSIGARDESNVRDCVEAVLLLRIPEGPEQGKLGFNVWGSGNGSHYGTGGYWVRGLNQGVLCMDWGDPDYPPPPPPCRESTNYWTDFTRGQTVEIAIGVSGGIGPYPGWYSARADLYGPFVVDANGVSYPITPINIVPEPDPSMLIGAGLCALWAILRHRSNGSLKKPV
jgi:hypothetical protein